MDVELRALDADDLPAYFALRAQAFARPEADRDEWIRGVDLDAALGAFDHGRLVGALRAERWGQWFGGRCLPMAGLASVVVAAEARGMGVGARLLTRVLADLHERATLVSTLHPATLPPYRRAGWEIAGDFAWYRVPTRSLARMARGEPERLTRLERPDWPRVQVCYERAAPARPGWVQRSPSRWDRLEAERFADQAFVYGVDGDDGELAGYVAWTQGPDGREWGHGLRVHELVSLTPEAGATLWSLLGAQAMQVESVVVPSAVVDDVLVRLAEQDVTELGNNRWMHRLVDVAGALEGRGWPAGVGAEVHLQVLDPVAPWNDGRTVLRVEGGRAEVVPGGTGEVQLGVGALSALAAGGCPARTLAAAGALHHADPTTFTTLDAVFAAPRPTLLDDF